jgi:hypothetical protein
MVAFNRVLKTPGSFLSEVVGTMLGEFGLQPFSSPSAQCLAALLRTAIDGKLEWAPLVAEILLHNREHVAMRRYVGQMFWDPHWLAPPFVVTLAGAAGHGWPLAVHASWQAPLLAGRAAAVAAAVAAAALPGTNRHIQAAASRAIADAHHAPGTLEAWLKKRLVTMFGSEAVSTLDLNNILQALKKFPPRLTPHLLRSWGNGWTTSSRMHSADVRCVVGCDATDSIQHYLKCVPLQNAISAALDKLPPICPLAAAGLLPMDTERPVLACLLYHTLKGLSGLPLSRLLRLPDLARAAARDVRSVHARAPPPDH